MFSFESFLTTFYLATLLKVMHLILNSQAFHHENKYSNLEDVRLQFIKAFCQLNLVNDSNLIAYLDYNQDLVKDDNLSSSYIAKKSL